MVIIDIPHTHVADNLAMLVDSLRKALEAARRPRKRSQIVHSAVIVKKGVEITEIRVSGARYLTRI